MIDRHASGTDSCPSCGSELFFISEYGSTSLFYKCKHTGCKKLWEYNFNECNAEWTVIDVFEALRRIRQENKAM